MSLSVINYSLKPLSVALLSQQRYKAISRFDFYFILQTIFLKFGIDIYKYLLTRKCHGVF